MPAVSAPATKQPFTLCESEKTFTVTDGDNVYVIDRAHGLLASMGGSGKELLSSPVTPTIWRAPTDNDRRIRRKWEAQFFHLAKTKC